jgi:ABC-type branched-subunit amino acid transport system substrate-binding protein
VSGCLAALLAFVLLAAACSSDGGGGPAEGAAGPGSSDTSAQPIDYAAIGLWDDGPCDASWAPLKIGLMTVFESPVLSLGDHATALEASAKAFNERGGANGACVQVVTCDDGGNVDQAVACVRTIDDAGVVATVNDLGTAGQAEVSTAMADAGIPRVASNVSNQDWGDHNAYPLDASGTGLIFLLPQALIEEGVTEIGIVRVDLAAASALKGLLADTYDGEATFPVDLPVAAGTTDYSQFILAADSGGAEGLALALGEQEAVQVARAAEQLDSDLVLGGAVSAFPPATIRQLGDLADQLVLLWSYAPATADLPVYEALRADLSASGDEALQPEHLTATAMRSWIGLYALIEMIRDAHLTEFTRAGITTMLDQAHDVPMLGMFGGEDWTPALDHPGVFQRAGINRWSIWGWDAQADNPDGTEGNFVPRGDLSFDEVMCGTPFGAPGPC